MNKRDILILLLVIVVLSGILFFLPFRMVPPPQPKNTITDVEKSKFPDSFPANLPIQGSIDILHNYNAVAPDGRVQATRSFTSVTSVDENFTFYKTFLSSTQNGWTIINEVNDPADPGRKALFARNADGTLSINISSNKISGITVVNLSFVALRAR